MNVKTFAIAISFLFLASCSSSSKTTGGGEGTYSTGNLESGYEHYHDGGRIYVGPQLSAENIKELKSSTDIDVLINLRGLSENKKVPFDAKTEARSVGLSYYQVPFMKGMTPSGQAITKIESILKKHSGQKALVYCASGNRAAGWYGAHKATNNSLSTTAAMGHAKSMGLNNRKLAGIMTAYLARSGITTEDIVEESTAAVVNKGQSVINGAVEGATEAVSGASKKMDDEIDDALETENPMDF